MKPKLIKIKTVLISRPMLRGKDKDKMKFLPLISLSGKWLEEYGFEVGRRYEVYAQGKLLLLKAKDFKYKNPIIKTEVTKK